MMKMAKNIYIYIYAGRRKGSALTLSHHSERRQVGSKEVSLHG